MAEVSATIMVLKVDLGCKHCYKKIKKLLNKIPEIQDWAFFEKENAVMIKVVSSSSEKIRTQLTSKGGETIKSIEVKKPKPPTPVRGCSPGYRIGGCSKPRHEGHCGGPCHRGCGIPSQPPSYDGYLRLVPSNDGWAPGCRCNRSCGGRCEFWTEENPRCTIL